VKTLTLSDYPLLIGKILARVEARERKRFARRNTWWRIVARWFGLGLRKP
jgi:hypothetical protein